jgi:3',5'-cyclic AMP phosphodiesterase CpdA
MFRIAHISDPHISRQFYREHIKSLKMLLRSIVDMGIDHIVISGDIVSTGHEDDYYLAREIFSKLGLLDTKRLTVVPGNHDIFGGPHRAVDVLSFPQHIRGVDYVRNKNMFVQAFAETFQGVRRLAGRAFFPFVKEIGPFRFLGLNSVPPWSLRYNPLGTNGFVNQEQFSALESIVPELQDDEFVNTIICHHHFNDLIREEDVPSNNFWKKVESKTMRMKKRKKLLRLFSEMNARYVLHGHIHRNEVYERNGILFANGAGAICDDPVRYLKYNVLEHDDGFCSIRICQLPIVYQESMVSMALHRNRKPLHIPMPAMGGVE